MSHPAQLGLIVHIALLLLRGRPRLPATASPRLAPKLPLISSLAAASHRSSFAGAREPLLLEKDLTRRLPVNSSTDGKKSGLPCRSLASASTASFSRIVRAHPAPTVSPNSLFEQQSLPAQELSSKATQALVNRSALLRFAARRAAHKPALERQRWARPSRRAPRPPIQSDLEAPRPSARRQRRTGGGPPRQAEHEPPRGPGRSLARLSCSPGRATETSETNPSRRRLGTRRRRRHEASAKRPSRRRRRLPPV